MKYLVLFLLSLSFFDAPVTTCQFPDRVFKGKVVDVHREPLLFANVIVPNTQIGATTDLDGRFTLMIPDTTSFVQVSYPGYTTQLFKILKLDSLTMIMQENSMLSEVIVTAYKVPLMEQDNTTQGGIKTAEQIRNLPTKNINDIAATTAGTSTKAKHGEVNIRGKRLNATSYYIDGIQVTSENLVKDKNKKFRQTPQVWNTEDYSAIVENTFHTPLDAPLSTFSIDVDVASYANMRRFLTQGTEPPKDAVRIEELVNYFDYDYPEPQENDPIEIISETGVCPWAPDHKLVHIGLQGKTIPNDLLPASNLVFLVDVSGSMQPANKLPLVIESFKILTSQLREQDQIAIVVYAGSSGLVLPSTSGSEKKTIIESLERLSAGGSTAGAAGIQLAYKVARENFIKNGNNRVILATDGDFNVGVSNESELVELIEQERESGIFLTVLGYGMGNYQDNKMEQLADHGNGNHGYVDNIEEAKKVFIHEFGGTLFAIAKDVKIQVEFNPILVAGYRLIGYENRMLQSEDFNDDKKDAGEIGSGHSVTALYEIIPVGVHSGFLKDVDELKYQKTKKVSSDGHSDELMTVKFRYKDPDGAKSKMIVRVVSNETISFVQTSENFRWSAAVASFGMILRDSEFAGKATYGDVKEWANGSIGKDEGRYRKEFIELIDGMSSMAKR